MEGAAAPAPVRIPVATMAALAEPVPPKAKKPRGRPNLSGKPSVVPDHPPYAEMIADAITALKEPYVPYSSRYAINKYILANFTFDDEAKALVRIKLAIRKMLEQKKLLPVRGKGFFKLAKEEPKHKYDDREEGEICQTKTIRKKANYY